MVIGVLASAVESTDDIDGFSCVSMFFLFARPVEYEMWEVWQTVATYFRCHEDDDADNDTQRWCSDSVGTEPENHRITQAS